VNPALWVYSWVMGRLPVLIALAAIVGGVWWYGNSQYNAGEAAVQARWDAATLKATEDARIKERAWQAAVDASDRGRNDALELVAAQGAAIGLLNDRVRYLATRPRPVANPAEPSACPAELARERDWADECGVLLSEGADALAAQAGERDAAVIDLWAAADAWPR
jgi:hypothetical protein